MRFLRSERGYALVLTLLFLPVFVGVGLIVVDIGRGNNAHSDHMAAADALALAGARELDGGADSIDRARVAMSALSNSVSFLGLSGADVNIDLVYEDAEGNEFTVVFLTDIPDSDDEPLDAAFLSANATSEGTEAQYVYVRSTAREFTSFFFNPIARERQSVPIGAYAVATYRSAACNVTPLYICNPFETQDINLQEAFAAGQLHGRLLRLHPKGSDTASPGNFGFLSVTGNNDNSTASANAIRAIFAGSVNPTCYEASDVTTKPGAAVSIRNGINVRFDMYAGPFSNNATDYPPAANVRKGYILDNKNNACSGIPVQTAMAKAYKGKPADYVEPPPEDWWAMPYLLNETMAPPGQGALGSAIGSGDWDIDTYWAVNHPSRPPLTALEKSEMSSFPSAEPPGASVPSRYDVYRYEIENDMVNDLSQGDAAGTAASKESGLPNCAASKNPRVDPVTDPTKDRRVIFAAIVDCLANAEQGGGINTYPVNSYASLFLARPMAPDPADATKDSTIDVEITDITGWGGNGTLDLFLRAEAVLVR